MVRSVLPSSVVTSVFIAGSWCWNVGWTGLDGTGDDDDGSCGIIVFSSYNCTPLSLSILWKKNVTRHRDRTDDHKIKSLALYQLS